MIVFINQLLNDLFNAHDKTYSNGWKFFGITVFEIWRKKYKVLL